MSGPRPSLPGEEAALRELWIAVFGDDGAFLELFFRELYHPGMAQIIEVNGVIVSAAYTIPFGAARYIYAVGTLPAYRGRGFGKAVTLAAADGRGAYLCPAGETLKTWYRETMGAVPADRRTLCRLPKDAAPIAAEEYAREREALLVGVPHASYSLPILSLFALDGGFYRDRDGALYAADRDGVVREKLPLTEGGEEYLFALNGAPPLHWGICME